MNIMVVSSRNHLTTLTFQVSTHGTEIISHMKLDSLLFAPIIYLHFISNHLSWSKSPKSLSCYGVSALECLLSECWTCWFSVR